MSKKTTYIHAENNNKILSSNEVRLYVPPEPEKMKVLIWGKELCNMAEWNDFLKCVEEKTEENKQLKQQLVEKEKELAYMTKQAKKFNNEAQKYYEDAYCNSFQNQKAIAELERLKEEFNGAFSFSTQQEMFDKYIDQQIAELKGETNE